MVLGENMQLVTFTEFAARAYDMTYLGVIIWGKSFPRVMCCLLNYTGPYLFVTGYSKEAGKVMDRIYEDS